MSNRDQAVNYIIFYLDGMNKHYKDEINNFGIKYSVLAG